MIERSEVEQVMIDAILPEHDGLGPNERNEIRRTAVIDYLDSVSDIGSGLQGRDPKEMILSDLSSYKEWERG